MNVTSLYEDSLTIQAEQAVSSSEVGVPILRRLVGDSMADNVQSLQFCFLGCEESVGYGPMEHTASLFLDLLCQAAESSNPLYLWTISIHIYNAKSLEYPATFDAFSGVILPGSYSSAYEENVDWIEKLKEVIQQTIVPQCIPTLGICFGHQILAHSFYPHGKCTKLVTEAGADTTKDASDASRNISDDTPPSPPESPASTPRAGRVSLRASQTGQSLLGGKPVFDLFVTHGDHVEKLPDSAVSLGGDDLVPIQAAAYYATAEEAQLAHRHSLQSSSNSDGSEPNQPVRPFAISFQSHLEYATSRDLGLHRTLEMIIEQMAKRGDIPDETKMDIQQDARESYPQVAKESVEATVMVGRLLGWFPFDAQ